jgi:hypothetical protein
MEASGFRNQRPDDSGELSVQTADTIRALEVGSWKLEVGS